VEISQKFVAFSEYMNFKEYFPFQQKIGKGKDETTKLNGSNFDESVGGFEKHENDQTNVVKGKEEHAKDESESESDSEFENLLNPLLTELKQDAYPTYESTGEFIDSHINNKKYQNIYFSFSK
jgi:hypothetical protein